ncbi:ATP-dependent DNA helicase PcrA [candidate division WWE3 bacterium CG10_big_fil_rev_8_21_14_0_10_39_14]|nr:MAG: ATP-dependent DNA helicase PcrA [candidate division WWE3 bacterium CG10_big_fil_rev_8_21_14_0_10_39_14]
MEDIFHSLNEEQKLAVKYFDGPSLIVAGPGSGKTRVLTHKMAYLIKNLNVSPQNILGITFTNKAANEIKERMHFLLENNARISWLGTFHSVCARILRRDGNAAGISPNYVIYDSSDQKVVIRSLIKKLNPSRKISPDAVSAMISGAKNELVSPSDYEKSAYGFFQEQVAKIYPQYQKQLEENNALDFDDLIVKTVELFRNYPNILNKYAELFKYILIDEYQDTNHSQYVFSKLLAKRHNQLCVVGDMSQSIYSFRGADFRNILNFKKDYPEAKIFNLTQNYRSTKVILDAATNLIKNNNTHIPLELWTQNSGGDLISLYEANDEKEEGLYIGFNILDKSSKQNFSFSDFAVLYRTNAQSRSVEEQFIKLGISYRLVGGTRFYDRKEIKDALSFLRILHNPRDTVSWERIINVPPRGIGKKALEELKSAKWDLDFVQSKSKLPLKELMADKKTLSVVELLSKVLQKAGYIDYLNDGSEENLARLENLEELKSVASQFLTLGDFLENAALMEALDETSKDSDAVTLMTLHSAKGLEFREVFIVGMEEGLFPHSRSLFKREDLEEERRLCYVGVTRAKEKLHLTYTRKRLYLGARASSILSRFIMEIPQDLLIYNTKSGMQTIRTSRGLEKYPGDFFS